VNQAYNPGRESVEIPGTPIRVSSIGLGTWAIIDPIGPEFMAPPVRS
jgi:hypothetical protein